MRLAARRPLVRIARYLWALPCTLTGLLLVLPAFVFGARGRIVDGVLEIANPLYEGRTKETWWPFRAITFGHLVIARTRADLDLLRAHEHAHVRQYERWGLFFFLAYPASSFWQILRSRRPYFDNWFEVRARQEAVQERFK